MPYRKDTMVSESDPLKNRFWYCPKCGKLNLGAWCPCDKDKAKG